MFVATAVSLKNIWGINYNWDTNMWICYFSRVTNVAVKVILDESSGLGKEEVSDVGGKYFEEDVYLAIQ